MLTTTTAWKAAAAAIGAKPMMLVEIKPTVLYDEFAQHGDWAAESSSNVDLNHPTGEVRLQAEEIIHPEKQQTTNLLYDSSSNDFTYYRNKEFEETDKASLIKDFYSDIGQFIQLITIDNGCRLKKIRIGTKASWFDGATAFNGKIICRIFTDIREPNRKNTTRQRGKTGLKDLYERAELLVTLEADYGETYVQGGRHVGQYLEWDLSEEYIFLKGGGRVAAIDLMVTQATGAQHVKLYGSLGGDGYTRGQLYLHDHGSGYTWDLNADLAFELIAEGYPSSGNAIWQLDMGEAPASGLTGELELKYVEPKGTSIAWEYRESLDDDKWTDWASCEDAQALNGYRYIQVRATLSSDSDGLRTPRIYTVRAAYKRSDRFIYGDNAVEGYPAIVKNAPSVSSEGDPLKGSVKFSDNSTVTLLDPKGMISDRLNGAFNLKNDEINFSVGFDGLSTSDYMKIKTLWIENFEEIEGAISFACYDMNSRVRKVEIPSVYDKNPDETEEVHLDLMKPGAMKTELLLRAGVRPSRIDSDNMDEVDTEFAWDLVHAIKKPEKVSKITTALNQHLLGFDFVDEAGHWKTAFIDYGAAIVKTLYQDDLTYDPAESYNPGWSDAASTFAVWYDGEGDKEDDYGVVAVLLDEAAAKEFKEISVDKLRSEFIPANDDPGDQSGIAITIANRRRTLLRDGYRSIKFGTYLKDSDIEIGDHISLYASRYDRPGAGTTNPLTVFIVGKYLNPENTFVEYSAIVLFDADQSAPSVTAVAPATSVVVTDNADGTVDIDFDKSTDDDGTEIKYYEISYRRWALTTWGAWVTRVTADGSASYTVAGLSIAAVGKYDFGVRAVNASGRVAAMAEAEDVSVTDAVLDPPTFSVIPGPGGWNIIVTADVVGANTYQIYQWSGSQQAFVAVGILNAPASGRTKFKTGTVMINIEAESGTAYGRFKLSTINFAGEGDLSSEVAAWALPYLGPVLGSALEPTMPAETGTYPLVITAQNAAGEQTYSVKLKIVPAASYIDLVARYEVQRREDSGGGYGDWNTVGEKIIDNYPAPDVLYWINSDAALVPGVTYQWRARAIAADGTASGWTAPLTETVAAPTTPFDAPVIVVTPIRLGFFIDISQPKRSAVVDSKTFAYYKIQKSQAGGGYTTVAEEWRSNLYFYDSDDDDRDDTFAFRVYAYDIWGNVSAVSNIPAAAKPGELDGDTIIAGTIVTNKLAFTAVQDDNVIATINASSEGGGTLNIAANKVAISGECTFSSSYDPTDKFDLSGNDADDIGEGSTYGKMPKAWKRSGDITKIDGGYVSVGSKVTVGTGTDVAVVDGANDTYRLYCGHSTAASAPFRVTKAGVMYCTGAVIDGLISTTAGLKTAASGARLEISSTLTHGLSVFDSTRQKIRVDEYGFMWQSDANTWIMIGALGVSPQPAGVVIAPTALAIYTGTPGVKVAGISTSNFMIGGTNFIDSSRNLSSIGTISCGAITSVGPFNLSSGGITITGGAGITAGNAILTTYVAVGTALWVDEVQVIGPQSASGVADATDAATAITQLNALLAVCRTHGFLKT